MHTLRIRSLFVRSSLVAVVLLHAWSHESRAQPQPPFRLNQYFNFRDARKIREPLMVFGPEVTRFARAETQGLRFNIPANRPNLDPVGVVWSGNFRGDFEITAGYEILKTTTPKTGAGIGFEIYIATFNPTNDAIAYTRVTRPRAGEVYFCTRMTEPDGKRQFAFQEQPAKVNRGWLRLARQGAEVVFLASDNPDGPFLEVWRNLFVTDDLKMVRLAAYSGGDPAPFDLRMLDLRVRTTAVKSPAEPAVNALDPQNPPDPVQAQPSRFVAVAIIFAALLGLSTAALLIWLFARSRAQSSGHDQTLARSVRSHSHSPRAGDQDRRLAARFPWVSMIVVTLLIAACVAYANLAFAVTDGSDYRYFPPFKAYANANMNRHLGAEYFSIARSLAAGEGFANPFREQTGPTAWMPPVFPFLLAGLVWLCNGHVDAIMTVIIFLQALVLALTGLLVVALVRQTSGRVATTVAGSVFALALLCDFHLHFQITHDSWLILLAMDVVLAGLCWARPLAGSGPAALWGIVGGLCALINPVVGFVWGVMTALLAFRQRAWTRLGWSIVAAGCMVLPWTVRNFAVFGRLVPVKSNAAFELYQSQCLQPDGLVQLQTFATHPYASPGWERNEYKEKGEMAFLDHKKAQFWQAVDADPLGLADRAAYRFLGATVLYVPFHRDTEPIERPWTFWLSRLIYPLPFLGFLLLLTAGIVGRLHFAQWLVLGIYTWYLLPYVAISYYDRYGMPLLAIKTLLVIWAIDFLYSIWRRACTPAT